MDTNFTTSTRSLVIVFGICLVSFVAFQYTFVDRGRVRLKHLSCLQLFDTGDSRASKSLLSLNCQWNFGRLSRRARIATAGMMHHCMEFGPLRTAVIWTFYVYTAANENCWTSVEECICATPPLNSISQQGDRKFLCQMATEESTPERSSAPSTLQRGKACLRCRYVTAMNGSRPLHYNNVISHIENEKW